MLEILGNIIRRKDYCHESLLRLTAAAAFTPATAGELRESALPNRGRAKAAAHTKPGTKQAKDGGADHI